MSRRPLRRPMDNRKDHAMARIVLGLGDLAYADVARLRRDADALSRNRPDHQASRQGRPRRSPMANCWRRPTPAWRAWSRRRIWSSGRTGARAACRHLRQVLSAANARRADHVRRRPERELSGGLPAGLRDLFRRHHPQRQQAAPDLFAPAGVVHQEPRRVLRAGQAARLSGACRARCASDRRADGRRIRSRGVEAPARRAKAKVMRSPMCIAT